ncbi:hypothetical protein VP01_30g5 [Puccinia sorghi]|uniref:Tet-like 2OG-Fe(II) oxygenase domain-containing protein n=1 Tax=Puccinia sorghi TaxID=27349 RepID=A0A0L6V0A1_9BASI|nr:hypothetical protein VP01_30g5 [Puccinia sorghi]
MVYRPLILPTNPPNSNLEEESLQVSSEDERGEGGKAEGNHCYFQLLSVFNYGSFSQITIQIQMPLDILGWRKGYEEASKIGITGIAAKVVKDPDGYCELQSHVPEQKTFIGKQFYSVSGPLFYEKILMVLLAIYPSLSTTLPTNPTKTMMPHPSHFSCGSQSNRPPVTWLKKTLK